MANKNFSEENYQRAKKFEAEKAADEDARIAELFGDPEQLDSTEPSPKSSDAAETENTAAGTTIAATTEKVTSEVIKAERNFREDFEKITSGAMRMFVNAGDTVRRIAKLREVRALRGTTSTPGRTPSARETGSPRAARVPTSTATGSARALRIPSPRCGRMRQSTAIFSSIFCTCTTWTA